MDILAHALWTNLAYYKKYRDDLKDRLWAVFFGIMPDLISFTPATIYVVFHHGGNYMDSLLNSKVWEFVWAQQSYNYTHSLVSFAVVTIIVLAIRKGKMYWPLLGWVLHIVIDIFTHHNFYETPFLYPLSHFKNNFSVSWSEPWFMAINYGCILILYILIFTVFKRKDAKPPA